MKRATREWLRWVVTTGFTPESRDALDSERRLKAEVRRLRAERDNLKSFCLGMARGFEQQRKTRLATSIRTYVAAALRPTKRKP